MLDIIFQWVKTGARINCLFDGRILIEGLMNEWYFYDHKHRKKVGPFYAVWNHGPIGDISMDWACKGVFTALSSQ